MEIKRINQSSMRVVSCEQMRAIDAATIENAGIPGIVLMENAANSVIKEIEKRFSIKDTDFAVFCGKGNNGGDGLAIARHLFGKGANVFLYLVLGNDFKGDALTNYKIAKSIGIPIIEIDNPSFVKSYAKSADVVVDAILGTGIKNGVSDKVKTVIEEINKNAKFVFSVDVPSGGDADTGIVETVAVRADVTVTFAAYKKGMFLYPLADNTGEIIVSDISIPQYIMDTKAGRIFVSSEEDIKNVFPKRKNNSHKGDYGKIMIIGGSLGMAGAVSMAAKAAFKSGAGLVTCAVPASINNVIHTKIDEATTLSLLEERGKISPQNAEKLASIANTKDAVLIGPGMGRGDSVREFVSKILPLINVPVVIDADAIFAISNDITILKKCNSPVILTPHSAEMGYLTNQSYQDVERDRFKISYDFATKNQVTLILKGHHTIITAPDGDMSVNLTGNPGMATGGSGDVLSGILAAFLSRGTTSYEAAVMAVHLHAKAGDEAAFRYSEESMTATDIIDSIYKILPVEN